MKPSFFQLSNLKKPGFAELEICLEFERNIREQIKQANVIYLLASSFCKKIKQVKSSSSRRTRKSKICTGKLLVGTTGLSEPGGGGGAPESNRERIALDFL